MLLLHGPLRFWMSGLQPGLPCTGTHYSGVQRDLGKVRASDSVVLGRGDRVMDGCTAGRDGDFLDERPDERLGLCQPSERKRGRPPCSQTGGVCQCHASAEPP